MTFADDWQAKLENSYKEFAGLVPDAADVDLVHGILATAILWPIREPLRNFDDGAMQAVQNIAGKEDAKQIFRTVQSWGDDPLDICRALAQQAKENAVLRIALSRLINHFDAWEHFPEYLAGSLARAQGGGDVYNLTEQIKSGMVNVGGVANIQNQTITIQMIMAGDQDDIQEAKSKPFPYEPEMVDIPAGPFLMGSDPGEGISRWETPQKEIELPAFRMGKYPVTNGEFLSFLDSIDRPPSSTTGLRDDDPPDARLPVAGVSWVEAMEYCSWLSDQTGKEFRLPTEAEWERGARGTDGRIYPWGNEWDPKCCNHGRGPVTPVEQFEAGISPDGCYDMIGNVREWTRTIWGPMRLHPDPKYLYPWAVDGRDRMDAGLFLYRVYRGGGLNDDINLLRCSARAAFAPIYPGPPGRRHGFRVVEKL